MAFVTYIALPAPPEKESKDKLRREEGSLWIQPAFSKRQTHREGVLGDSFFVWVPLDAAPYDWYLFNGMNPGRKFIATLDISVSATVSVIQPPPLYSTESPAVTLEMGTYSDPGSIKIMHRSRV